MLFEHKQQLRADMAMIKMDLALVQSDADSKQWQNKQNEGAHNNFVPLRSPRLLISASLNKMNSSYRPAPMPSRLSDATSSRITSCFSRAVRPLGMLLFVAYLSGCGGGDSSDSTPPVPVAPVAPVVTADPVVVPEPAITNTTGAGQLKDAIFLKTITTAQIVSAMESSGQNSIGVTPRYAVQAYRLTYLTVDGLGKETLASALVTVPQKPLNVSSPVLSYQHGTITKDADAPSQLAKVETPEVVMASLGYIVLSADYVGYGASKGVPHPYLLSAPSAAAVIDLMTAAKYWRETNKVLDNQQLFMAGYSEGGYVTMATHRALQAGNSSFRLNLVSVVPGAGPYNVALTLGEQLKIVRRANPLIGALINPGFLKYLSEADRNNVRDKLLAEVQGDDSDVVFSPTFLSYFLNDDQASIDRFSSVHNWRPEIPVTLYHGRDDRSVSYLNSSSTLETMRAQGATATVSLTNCTVQPAGHRECVLPYWRFMLDQFARQAKDL